VDREHGDPYGIHFIDDQNVRHLAIISLSNNFPADSYLYSIALWERRWAIVVPLLALCLVHWGLLYRGMFIVRATWDNTAQACIVSSTRPELLKINFFYSKFALSNSQLTL
jgi:hypothetical protein